MFTQAWLISVYNDFISPSTYYIGGIQILRHSIFYNQLIFFHIMKYPTQFNTDHDTKKEILQRFYRVPIKSLFFLSIF